MIVYVVEASSGSYDAFSKWIHSIHTNKDVANKERDRINSEWDEKLKCPAPFPVDEDGDLIDELLSDEEKKKYNDWWSIKFDAEEWNGAKVREFETDKIYPEYEKK